MLQTSPDSAYDIKERLAQAYYLSGLRKDAIQLYEELVYRDGYRKALLGLGEAKDDMGDPQDAVMAYDLFLATESEDRNKAIAHVKKGLALSHLKKHESVVVPGGERFLVGSPGIGDFADSRAA